MAGQKRVARLRVSLNEIVIRVRELISWVDVGGAVPVGMRQLDRVVDRVAGN